MRAGSDGLNDKSIYAVHAALGLSVSDILLQGCQPIIVEGPSDQHYFNGIKQFLIKNKKFAPQQELVFMPSGGVKGIAGVVSIVSGKEGSLPMVILDADGSGKAAMGKLKANLYKDHINSLIDIGALFDFENAEVEDLIPISLIARPIDRLFRDVEDQLFSDSYQEGYAILPQIEAFAQMNNISLYEGWKVDVARGFKQQLMKTKIEDVPERYLSKWKELFDKFNI